MLLCTLLDRTTFDLTIYVFFKCFLIDYSVGYLLTSCFLCLLGLLALTALLALRCANKTS